MPWNIPVFDSTGKIKDARLSNFKTITGTPAINTVAAAGITNIAGFIESGDASFFDYGGNTFVGEAGALVVNDNWAATVYDYTRQFAPTIGTLPTPTNDPTKPGVSGVNPSAADEFLCIDRAGLVTALNNATYRYIFIAKGSECTDTSDNDEMTLTISGASGTERYIIYWDDITPANVNGIEPWNQAQVDRVNMPRIEFDSADFTWLIGLSWGEIGNQLMRAALFSGTSSDNIYYRCNMENAVSHCWNVNDTNCDNNIAFECVNHDHTDGTGDTHCFIVNGGSNTKIISCEGWDFLGDFFQVGNGTVNGGVVEDCDIYRKTFYDGNGNIDAGGDFGAGEGGLDFKKLNADMTSRFQVYGNRFWDLRRVDLIKHPGGGVGSPVAFSNNAVAKYGLDVRWNILFDCTDAGIRLSGGDLTGGDHSVVRNILSNIGGKDSSHAIIRLVHQTTEEYLNTVVDGLGATDLHNYNRNDETDIDVHDSMGNFYQDTTIVAAQDHWGTDFQRGYNAYAGTYVLSNKTYGNDYEAPSKAALNMGDFTFKRKKLTGIENHTINGIVPTTSTPSGFTTLVPTTGFHQIGSRTGIGVDDLPISSSPALFEDVGGFAFNGEAGALAVNDDWASTIYNYVPQFTPTIPTIPTYNASGNQILVTDQTSWDDAVVGINDGTYDEVYIQKGVNLYTGTASDNITFTGFTEQNPLWITAYDDVTPTNNGEALRVYEPWNEPVADRARCGQIQFDSCPYVYIVGISWGEYGIEANDIGRIENGCHFFTLFRCHAEGWGGGWEDTDANNPTLDPLPFPMLISNGGTLKSATVGGLFHVDASCDFTTIYQCNFERNIPTDGGEVKCLDYNGQGGRIVGSSFIDSGTVVQLGLSGTCSGTLFEDNDCHKTKFYDVDGLENPNGLYGANEGYIGFKIFNPIDTTDESEWGRFYGNRFSGARRTCPAFDLTPSSGATYFLDSGGGPGPVYPKWRRDLRWNICEDTGRMPFILNFGDNAPDAGDRDSVVRNISYDQHGGDTNGNTGFFKGAKGAEIYLNTIKKSVADRFMSFFDATHIVNNFDVMGNLWIDIDGIIQSGDFMQAGTCNFGYNVYADFVDPAFNLNYGNDIITTEVGLGVMGDFTYIRFKLTNPTQSTIPGIVPTSSTLASVLSLVPMTGNDQVGNKSGFGIDDDF